MTNNKRTRLVYNTASSFVLQLSNYVVPLLILPYLAQQIGIEGFGIIAFSQSFALLVSVIPEYGFGLTATRRIAKNVNDKSILKKTISTIIALKGVLTLFGLLLYTASFWIVPLFQNAPLFYYSSAILFISYALNFDWYFYGVEKLHNLALIQAISKLLMVLMVYLTIVDYYSSHYYLIYLALSNLGVSLFSLSKMKHFFDKNLVTLSDLRTELKESLNMFIFKVFVSFYTTVNVFYIGFIVPAGEVGIYAGAEKIVRAVNGIWAPVSNVLYPKFSSLVNKDYYQAQKKLNLVLLLYFILGASIAVFLLLTSDIIVKVLLGTGFEAASNIIVYLVPISVLVPLSNCIGYLWLLANERDKSFNRIIGFAALVNITFGLVLTYSFGIVGTAIAVVVSEFYVTISFFLMKRRQEIK